MTRHERLATAKPTLHAPVKDLAGWYCRLTVAGRTLYGTPYYPTAAEAEAAARKWLAENPR